MQHPVGYAIAPDGSVYLISFWKLLLNPWALSQYAHNMGGAVVTAAFVMTSTGAYYILSKRFEEFGKTFIRLGVITGTIASIIVLFPTGDMEAKNVAMNQGAKFAAMEGLFETKYGAELIIIGQPDMEKMRLDNSIHFPKLLSFLTYNRWNAFIKGMDAFPKNILPDNIPLLYYSYHIMVGLGTIFIAIMIISTFLLWRKRLFETSWALWMLLVSFPFPYIANTAGWMTAEIGRQPWLVYGLMQTVDGTSQQVSEGNALFTFLGFLGMYLVLGILFIMLTIRIINVGPSSNNSEQERIS